MARRREGKSSLTKPSVGGTELEAHVPPTPQAYEGFFDEVAEVLRHIKDTDANDVAATRKVVERAVRALPAGLHPDDGIGLTDIIASSSLGGGEYPCKALECRVKRAREGARFAALYADKIWIRDPFELLSHHTPDDAEYVGEALSSISSLLEWKPLLLTGIAGHLAPICIGCASHRISEERLLNTPVDELAFDLLDELIEEATATAQRNPTGELNFKLDLPLRYTGHRELYMYPGGSIEKRLAKFLGRRSKRRVPKRGRIAFDAFVGVLRPIVNEAVMQAIHRGLTGGTYASNLPADLEIASRTNFGGKAPVEHAPEVSRVLATIKHTIPVIENVPVSTVVALRQDDDASFQLYRGRIAALRADIRDLQRLKEAAAQLRSEFAALETRIASRKKSIWGGIRDQVKIATGTVTAGLGLWLGHVLNPTWSAVVAAAGGLPIAQRLASDALNSRNHSTDEMSHPLYFLWRVKKSGQRGL